MVDNIAENQNRLYAMVVREFLVASIPRYAIESENIGMKNMRVPCKTAIVEFLRS